MRTPLPERGSASHAGRSADLAFEPAPARGFGERAVGLARPSGVAYQAAPSGYGSHCVRLTLQKHHPKSNVKVSSLSPDLYARWRALALAAPALQEADEAAPSERLLQQIWEHQRLRRDQLTTLDGQKVRVLHPGFWNHEAGPDFRGAVLQLGAELPRTGDVEIDLHPTGWRGHGHDVNPAYHNVVLHVVWNADSKAVCSLPTLALRSLLDSPLNELSSWFSHDTGAPGLLTGQCSAPLRDLPEHDLREVLHQAALIRLRRKASEFAARARQAGWEQSLWEGLFGALGYKHNVWPMRRVAELLPVLLAGQSKQRPTTFALQARLLGTSGLLPTELTRARTSTDHYLRRVWDYWWREREQFADFILPRELWRFNGLRPANHPQRRLALAAHWLAAGSLPHKLELWFTANIHDNNLQESLRDILQAKHDDFWSRHWTFRFRRKCADEIRNPRAEPNARFHHLTSSRSTNFILPDLYSLSAFTNAGSPKSSIVSISASIRSRDK